MLMIPLHLSVTNDFLVKAGDKYVLIDTAMKRMGFVRRRLNEADAELAQVSHIILTHHHDDHCGLGHRILRENGSIRVVMSHLCKDLPLKGENDRTHVGGFFEQASCPSASSKAALHLAASQEV